MTEEHKQLSFREHALNREIFSGTSILTKGLVWIWNGRVFEQKKVMMSDALMSIIGEALDNAIDHYITKITSDNPVSNIRINIDDSGYITIRNDGECIPIVIKKWKYFEGYLPTGLLTEERSGSRFNDDEDPDRVTGGLNGYGIKLTNVWSKEMTLTTCDGTQIYIQTCRDNMGIIDDYILKKCEPTKSFTELRFLPDYDNLCEISRHVSSVNWIQDNIDLMKKMLYYRVSQMATFIACIPYRYDNGVRIEYNQHQRAAIYFNNKLVQIDSLETYMKMFGIKNPIVLRLQSKSDAIQFPWTIGLTTIDEMNISKPQYISLMNGICLTEESSHITAVIDHITMIINTKYNREINAGTIKRLLCYFDCKQFPIRLFNFSDGNKKKKITIGKSNLNHLKVIFLGKIMKSLTINPEHSKFIETVWNRVGNEYLKLVKDNIDKYILHDDYKKQISTLKKNKKAIRKYVPARKAGSREAMQCKLILTEGDTANGPITSVISSKETSLNADYYGTYIIQGVPMNACKTSTIVRIGNKTKVMANENLLKNIGLTGLANALGLDFEQHYELNKEGNAQFASLNYGCVIVATDQDLDGIGGICSLIIVYLLRFWPALFKRKFFKRLATPIIRIHLNDSMYDYINFYSDDDYNKYVIEHYGSHEALSLTRDKVHYYKGLGGHDDYQVITDIGLKFNENIVHIDYDDECIENMIKFYDNDASFRKIILSTPHTNKYIDDLCKQVSISEHFLNESKPFQLDFLRRKLPCIFDNMIPVYRKILCYMRSCSPNNFKKVFQISGAVALNMAYAHGDASMNKAITKMAQIFPGSNNIPPLLPSGYFGNISVGRGKDGGARYISAKYNTFINYIFPPEDDCLLTWTYSEGQRCEPEYYVSVIPYSIIESTHTPAPGWAIETYGRDIRTVIQNTRRMVNGQNLESMLGKIQGDFIFDVRDNVEYSYGEYKLVDDILYITKLPIREWTSNYCHMMMGVDSDGKPITKEVEKDGKIITITKGRRKGIKGIKDDSDLIKNIVDIKIKIDKKIIAEELKRIKKKNMDLDNSLIILKYFKLYKVLKSQINMINENEHVTEFNTYEDVMKHWFPVRKQMYISRIERYIKTNEYKLLFWREVLRFIELDINNKIDIDDDKTNEQRIAILESHKFIKFNKKFIFENKYIHVSDLHRMIFDIKASYKYIDHITKKDESDDGIRIIKEKISNIEDTINKYKNTTWQELWNIDLNKLENKIYSKLEQEWKPSKKKR